MISLQDIIANLKPIDGQDHMLAYITPREAEFLRQMGGGVTEGGGQVMEGGVPAFPPRGAARTGRSHDRGLDREEDRGSEREAGTGRLSDIGRSGAVQSVESVSQQGSMGPAGGQPGISEKLGRGDPFSLESQVQMPSGETPGVLQHLPGVGSMMMPAFKTAQAVGGFLGQQLGGAAPAMAGPGSSGFASRGMEMDRSKASSSPGGALTRSGTKASFVRPSQMQPPGFLKFNPMMTPLQIRSQIATMGTAGEDSKFRDPLAGQYWKNLVLRELISDEGRINKQMQVLPVEREYASNVLGIFPVPDDLEQLARALA